MDYEVHINSGSEKIEPIILHLLPGEETIFDLRLVNQGDPAHIYLETNRPLKKAVRIKEADHHLTSEKVVPVLARMPDHVDRLDDYISVAGEESTLKIPFSMIRDDDTEDAEDKGVPYMAEDEDRIGEEEEDQEGRWEEAEDSEASEYAPCYGDDQEEEPEESERSLDPQESKRPSYTARSRALRAKREASANSRDYHEDDSDGVDDNSGDDREGVKQGYYREGHRVDDRERSLEDRQGQVRGGYEEEARDIQGIAGEASEDLGQESYYQPSGKGGFSLGTLNPRDMLLTLPSALVLTLIISLILTFYASAVPELLGALVSSILIVTLIIYGAATLLKA